MLQTSTARPDIASRNWKIDALVFGLMAVAVTLIFFDGRLDLAAARTFYSDQIEMHWPLGGARPWSVLYRLAPWITASLAVLGLGLLTCGLVRKHNALQRNAIFLLLSVALGPGLLINGIFKDHWDRPRPRDIVEFAGELPYAPAPLRGEGGKSFPCGHCSVGFLYAAGWWIWRRRRPRLAVTSLMLGIAAGVALGAGRMAAGGHFLSDVVWSAVIALGVAHALYHYVLRVPQQEAQDAVPAARLFGPRALATLAATGGLGVLAALFAAPHGVPLAAQIPLGSFPHAPAVFELEARSSNVEITIVEPAETSIAITGELHGFGLPGSQLSADAYFYDEPEPMLTYRIEQHGWFTDLDAAVSVRLPAVNLRRVVVRVQQGNIKVADATRKHVVKTGEVTLELHTDSGRIRTPGG